MIFKGNVRLKKSTTLNLFNIFRENIFDGLWDMCDMIYIFEKYLIRVRNIRHVNIWGLRFWGPIKLLILGVRALLHVAVKM